MIEPTVTHQQQRDPLDVLAEEFVSRFRNGERPSIEEYVRRHPDLAEKIRRTFPALAMMEELAPQTGSSGGPAASAPPPLEHGRGGAQGQPDQLGDYRIIREIGRGGMGVVYEAEQMSLSRHVALKLLPPQALAGDKQLRRFEREARAAARLHHTNIVPVFGVGESDGTHYYVMQYIPGKGLDEVLDEVRQFLAKDESQHCGEESGPDAPSGRRAESAREADAAGDARGYGGDRDGEQDGETATDRAADTFVSSEMLGEDLSAAGRPVTGRNYWHSVARIGLQAAQALEHAHAQGVLHRDIKPGNLLLDVQGTVWVTDFGLAKTGEPGDLTQTGDVIGTLRYMAPETFGGRTDERSDVYSLGLTLYELLALRPAFDETERSRLLRQVMDGRVEPLRRLNPDVPRDLETIVHKAIEPEPGHRYRSAGELAADLERFLDDEPIRARPIRWPERTWRWCRRNPLIASLTAGMAALLLSAAGASSVAAAGYRDLAAEKQRAYDAANNQRRQAEAAREKADEARRREERLRRQADAMAEERRRQLYAAHVLLAQREWEAGNVERVLELLAGHRPGRGQSDLRGFEWYHLWKKCHGERQVLYGHPAPVRAVAFSPDGKLLATASDKVVKLWESGSGELLATLHPRLGVIWSLAFAPDGRTLAVGGQSDNNPRAGAAALLDVEATEAGADVVRLQLPSFREAVLAVAFSPDGKSLATGTAPYYGQFGTPATRLVYIGNSQKTGRVQLWDVQTGRPRAILPGTTGGILSLAYSPDGNTLAAGSWDTRVRLWDVAERELPATLAGQTGYVWSVAFSPDGQTLAAGSGKWDGPPAVNLWDVAEIRESSLSPRSQRPGREIRNPQPRLRLRGHRSGVTAVAFSPDGNTLATAGWDRTVRLWDLETGIERDQLIGHSGYLWAVAFSPDGKRLATGSWDRTARLWHTDRRLDETVFPAQQIGGYYTLAFSPDGKRLAAAGPRVQVTDLAGGGAVTTFDGHAQTVVAFSPDGKWVATAGMDRRIAVRDTAEWKVRHVLKGHTGTIWSVAFSPEGRLLASGGADNTARLWNVADGRQVAEFEGYSKTVRSVAFSPDGKLLAGACHVGQGSGAIKVWEVPTGRLVAALRQENMGHSRMVECVAFTPDGKTLATCSHDRTAKLWDTSDWSLRATLKGHQEVIYHLAVSPDGRTLATASWDGTVRLWSISTGGLLATLGGHQGVVYWVAFSPDGKTLAAGSGFRAAGTHAAQVKLFHAATDEQVAAGSSMPGVWDERLLATWGRYSGEATSLAFSSSGEQLAVGQQSGSIILHEPAGGRFRSVLDGHDQRVRSLDFSPDDRLLITGGADGRVILWETAGRPVSPSNQPPRTRRSPDEQPRTGQSPDGWKKRAELQAHTDAVYGVAFAPDGRTAASCGTDKLVVIWDLETGNIRHRLTGHSGPVSCVAFCPDGNTLASGSWDGTVRLWDADSGKLLRTLEAHNWGVTCLAFAPDGRTVAAGGGFGDPVIHVWDLQDGKRACTMQGHSYEITGVAFSQDGRRLFSVSHDWTLRAWDARSGRQVQALVAHAGPLFAVAVSPTGNSLASAGGDRTVRIWELERILERPDH